MQPLLRFAVIVWLIGASNCLGCLEAEKTVTVKDSAFNKLIKVKSTGVYVGDPSQRIYFDKTKGKWCLETDKANKPLPIEWSNNFLTASGKIQHTGFFAETVAGAFEAEGNKLTLYPVFEGRVSRDKGTKIVFEDQSKPAEGNRWGQNKLNVKALKPRAGLDDEELGTLTAFHSDGAKDIEKGEGGTVELSEAADWVAGCGAVQKKVRNASARIKRTKVSDIPNEEPKD